MINSSPMTESCTTLKQWIQHDQTSFHDFTEEEANRIQLILLDWYRSSRRKLPWRGDPGPYNGSTAGFASASTSTKVVKKAKNQKSISSFFEVKSSKIKANIKAKSEQCQNGEIFPAQPVTPYGVWVSEIMLQQTRVEAVIPYYLKWMERFPTVNDLAVATDEEVNSYWAGLGFYRRARLLHAGAKVVINNFNGTLPNTVDELITIKGIGRYTASAIASIAYNVPVAVLDGNVCRVLSRLKGVANHIKAPIFKDKLGWKLAEQIIHANGGTNSPGEINQALMELGATYCAPSGTGIDPSDPLREFYMSTKLGSDVGVAVRNNKIDDFVGMRSKSFANCCELCNNDAVLAIFTEIANELHDNIGFSVDDSRKIGHSSFPLNPPKKEKREDERSVAVLNFIINNERKWLMVKRPSKGLLAGQWEFPSVPIPSEKGKDKDLTASLRSNAVEGFLQDLRVNAPDFVSKQDLSTRKSISKAVEHIFSHVRHTSHIEYITYNIDEATPNYFDSWHGEVCKQEVRLMTEADMADVGITAEVKKIIGVVKSSAEAYQEAKQGTTNNTKRKRPIK